MLKKIFCLIIIFFTLYILSVFLIPEFIDKYGYAKLNEFVRDFKTTIDNMYVNLPTKEELKEFGNQAMSGAENVKNNVVDGVNAVKQGVDDVRKTLSGAVDKYGEIKDSVNEARNQFEEGVDKLKEAGNSVNNALSGILQNDGSGKVIEE